MIGWLFILCFSLFWPIVHPRSPPLLALVVSTTSLCPSSASEFPFSHLFLRLFFTTFSLRKPTYKFLRPLFNEDLFTEALWSRNNQECRCLYWATRSSVRSFARTAHSFACSALLALLARSAALTLFAHSLVGQ